MARPDPPVAKKAKARRREAAKRESLLPKRGCGAVPRPFPLTSSYAGVPAVGARGLSAGHGSHERRGSSSARDPARARELVSCRAPALSQLKSRVLCVRCRRATCLSSLAFAVAGSRPHRTSKPNTAWLASIWSNLRSRTLSMLSTTCAGRWTDSRITCTPERDR